MLGRHYRLIIVNKTGVTLVAANSTFTINARGGKYDSDGALEYSASELNIMTDFGSNISDGASFSGGEIDNTTDLFSSLLCTAKLETTDSTDGVIDIYYEFSTDGGTTYPSDANDFDPEVDLIKVASMVLGTTTEDRTINFVVG